MRDVLDELLRVWQAGGTAGLSTVVRTMKSAPRPPGAAMVVSPDGTVAGSVSGGCVEGAVYETANEVVASGTPELQRYGVSDDDAFSVGLTCGGIIDIFPPGESGPIRLDLFGDVLDVKFRNDGPTSVQIQTEWTSSSITVRIVGIKRYEVTSAQSARSRPTSPPTITIPAGEACSASGGGSGFTITDTRTLRDIVTGETRTESHTVRYDPIPKVVCGG